MDGVYRNIIFSFITRAIEEEELLTFTYGGVGTSILLGGGGGGTLEGNREHGGGSWFVCFCTLVVFDE